MSVQDNDSINRLTAQVASLRASWVAGEGSVEDDPNLSSLERFGASANGSFSALRDALELIAAAVDEQCGMLRRAASKASASPAAPPGSG
jgi:hypothetical protein